MLTPRVRELARARGWFDHADGIRKTHRAATPRIGGIAIIAGFYAPLVALPFVHSALGSLLFVNRGQVVEMALGGLAIGTLGLYDDLRGANAYTKFGVQFLVAGVLYICGFRIEILATPLGTLHLGAASVPLTLLWIVGVTNAMNLIDGLDGLAGGVALISLTTIFAIATLRGEPIMMLFCASLAGATCGFLFYNFNPATIFMGDSGSMFLGFMLATSTIKASQKVSTAVAISIPIVLLAIPLADTTCALFRRAARGQRLFSGDHEHIHHRLMALGLSHRQAVYALYGACGLFAVCSLALFVSNDRRFKASLLVTLAVFVVVAARRIWKRSTGRLPIVIEPRLAAEIVEDHVEPDLRKRASSKTLQPASKSDRLTTRS